MMERWEDSKLEPITIILDVLSNLWVIILGAIAAALLTSVIVSESYVPKYTTSATFAVSSKTNSNAISNLAAANSMAKTFQSIIQSNTMDRIVCENLGVDSVDAEISCSIIGETNLLTLSVTANTSKEAYDVIRTVMDNYEKVSYFALGDATMLVLEEPMVPTYPMNFLNVKGDMKKAFVYTAAILAVLFAVLSYLKDTIKQEKDVEGKLDARCLGCIAFERKYKTLKAFLKHKKSALLVNDLTASFVFVESYKKLAAKVDYQMQRIEKQVLVVTSVLENEGKSTVAANLAISLAAQQKKVILLEGDLRRPAQFLIFGKQPKDTEEVGEYLKGNLKWEDILQESSIPNLKLILGKNCYSSSTEILQREELESLLERAKEVADYVIVDSSPIGVIGDSEVLAESAGAVLVVVKQDLVLAEDINDALDSFRGQNSRILGVVLNGVLGMDSLPGSERLGKYGKYGNYVKAGEIEKYE